MCAACANDLEFRNAPGSDIHFLKEEAIKSFHLTRKNWEESENHDIC